MFVEGSRGPWKVKGSLGEIGAQILTLVKRVKKISASSYMVIS